MTHRSTDFSSVSLIASWITPKLGVVPPTARLSHSSMRPAPAAIALSINVKFSAQNSKISMTTPFS